MKRPHSAVMLSCHHLGPRRADAGLGPSPTGPSNRALSRPCTPPTVSLTEEGLGSETLPRGSCQADCGSGTPTWTKSAEAPPGPRAGLTFLPAYSFLPSVSWRRDRRMGPPMQGSVVSERPRECSGHHPAALPSGTGGKDSRAEPQASCSGQDTLVALLGLQGFKGQGLQAGEGTPRPGILPPRKERSLWTKFPGSGLWSCTSSRLLGNGNMFRHSLSLCLPPCPTLSLSLCPPPCVPVSPSP